MNHKKELLRSLWVIITVQYGFGGMLQVDWGRALIGTTREGYQSTQSSGPFLSSKPWP